MIRSLSLKFAGATVLLLALLVSFVTPVATVQASTPSIATPSQHFSLPFTQFAQPTPPETTTCAVEKIGWIICPIFEGAARAADRAFVFLAEWFLEVPPELFNNESKTKDAWEQARNLANVAFVIAFLILIYSQITGGVMSNYGIKRMLPRLIIAAIAVNISYYICQALVDVSNLLGFNIKAALDAISKDLPQVFYQDPNQAGSTNTQTSNSGLSAITIGVLGAAGVAWALMGIMGGSLGVAIGTIIFILIILMLRKALIILLIVVSPLAFVAYLLPNTENYFKQWLNMFWQLLLVFPIVALLLGGGQLAGGIVLNSGVTAQGQPTTNQNCTEGVDVVTGKPCGSGTFETGAGQAPWGLGLAAAVITVGPLVLVYAVIKAAVAVGGAAFGKMSAQIEGASKGAAAPVGAISTAGFKGVGKAAVWGVNKSKYTKAVKVGLDRRKKNKESRAILKGAETLEKNEWLGNLLENKVTGGGGKAAADSTRAASVSAVKEMSEQSVKEQQALALYELEHHRHQKNGGDVQAWEHLKTEYAKELNEGDGANVAKLNALKSLLDQQGKDGQVAINAVLESFMRSGKEQNHKFKEHAQHVSLHDGAMTANNMAGYMTYYNAGNGHTTMGAAFDSMGIPSLKSASNARTDAVTPLTMSREYDMYGSLGAAQQVNQVPLEKDAAGNDIAVEGTHHWLVTKGHAQTAAAAAESRANARVDTL